MNAEARLRGRRNADGSVDVWLRGRRVHFPGNGQPPTVTEDDAPPARGALPDDVLSDLSETMATVSYDGWYVRLGESKLEINRTRARRVSGQRKFGRPLERHRRSR